MRRYILFYALLITGVAEAAGNGSGPAYVVDSSTKVYSVDLNTGDYTDVVTIPGAVLADIALLNSTTAYAIDSSSGGIYSINIPEQQYTLLNSIGSNFYSIALLNSTDAVTVNYGTASVYKINLSSGTTELIGTIPGTPGPVGIAVANDTLAYTACYDTDRVYSINLQTGASNLVTMTPLPGFPEPWGIAVNGNRGYVGGDVVYNIFNVNLSDGSNSLVSPTDIGSSDALGIALDGNTAYLTNTAGEIYAVNLLSGSYSLLSTIPGASLYGISLVPFTRRGIPTVGLSGNDLTLANYLNANASSAMIASLSDLGGGLVGGLAAVSPLRNGITTFSAQNSYMASSQTLIDHMSEKRLQKIRGKSVVAAGIKEFADEYIAGPIQPIKVEKRRDSLAVWATPFGEYARVKSGGQLPTFEAGLGGVVAGFDCNSEAGHSIGIGGAYVYTHAHEENSAGRANINQGYLSLYGEASVNQWYFDLGLWGGYYSSENVRNIDYPGIRATARAAIQGWQFASHCEVGYDGFLSKLNQSRWLGVEPFILADWVADWEKGFKETGAGSYNMGQGGRFSSLFRGETGVRFYQAVQIDWGRIFFTEKGSYAYQKAFNTGKITAYLVGSAENFTVEALQQAQNLGVLEFCFLFAPKNRKIPYFELRYQGEFSSRYQSHQGMLEIGKSF